ncbi:beta-lactamase [Capronia coronata CBS 617.96]|uniref:Beta-lactamase n=1 Tax=Capronia coronata CBS 617.96 TaxID=1182541 RepID=W9YMC5_9EURO|nr:beta-lactamase [Capronia coronata CBS 617.96]EXJ93718.1 beta-lactamase [Capronia coronata CBS 617.96]
MEKQIRPLLEAAVKDKRVPGIGAFLVDSQGNFLLKEACGTNNIDDPDATSFTADTTIWLYSCSKIFTTIAALQLVGQGKLSLSDPVEKYVPRISKIQVLEGFSQSDSVATDQPILRAPKSKPTILHLLTHTAGFSYDFFNVPTLRWRRSTGRPSGKYNDSGAWEEFETPLMADPGTKYVYGVNTDWLGAVVQQITGMPLPEYVDKAILKPLGMEETSSHLREGKERLAIHLNLEGKLSAHPEMVPTETPELWGGGAFLYSTMNDLAKLLSTLLNAGTSPVTGQSILKPETVKDYLFTDHLPPDVDKSLLGVIRSSIPAASHDGSFFPSLPPSSRGWSCGLLLNHEDLPRGRKRGSGGWAGLANLYYWIDPASNIAGMVCTGMLPFFDPVVVKLFDQLERLAYGHELAGPADDRLGNIALFL